MKKNPKYVYVCQGCGFQSVKWMGRCPDCGQWNSFVEEVLGPLEKGSIAQEMGKPLRLNEISLDPELRFKSDINEFDRTLGGGIVPGSMVLIGGDPGIGKSTLVLQVAGLLADKGLKTLYLSGEESQQQIRMRAERLSVCSENLFILNGTCIEELFKRMENLTPGLLIVDSVQTVYTEALPSAPGSVGQVREVATKLLNWSKMTGTPTFLIGHVTKEGAIAGPKVLEHLVDTVLYIEGDPTHAFRIVRSVKNRFGATNEIGVFEMKDRGLKEVGNPSRIFLEERPRGAAGSVVIPCIEGTRPLLVEVQALVGPSPLGMPRRTAIGVDHNRISLLVAVLGKRMDMEIGDQDIFVNVAGGLKVTEPAVDLGIVCAMVSSFLDKPLANGLVVFGEVGLAGEVRGVNQPEMRLREAHKLGFSRCLLSKRNMEGARGIQDIELIGIESIKGLLDVLY